MALAPTSPPLTRNTLKVIRAALLLGVLLFGGVIWYLHSTEAPTPLTEDAARGLRLVFFVIAIADLPLLIAVRAAQARASTYESAGRLAIVGWALGEAVALLGGVIYLLTTDVSLYLVGTAVLLASFVFIPVPDRPEP